MELSKTDIKEIRKRLAKTDGGIKRAAAFGGVTERVVHKLLKGENCRQATIDAFYAGITELEEKENKQRAINSRNARATATV